MHAYLSISMSLMYASGPCMLFNTAFWVLNEVGLLVYALTVMGTSLS